MTLALSLFIFWVFLWLINQKQPQLALKTKLLLLLLIAPVVLYPFIYSPVWFLRGLTGDLSMLTLFLLASALNQQLFGRFWLTEQERQPLEITVVVVGLCFYPLALGLGGYDPYVLGYGDIIFVSLLIIMAALCLWKGFYMLAIILMLALASWNIQLLQSVNLWGYLIDPFIFFFYLGRVIRHRITSFNT